MRFQRSRMSGGALLVVLASLAARPRQAEPGNSGPAKPSTQPTTRQSIVALSPPATRPTVAQIEGLVARLSGETWGERQQAQESLIELGEDAEPRLRLLVEKTSDQEAATRAQAVLRMIADNRLVGMTLISLKLNDVTPAIALKELAARAHIEIATDPDLWTQKVWPTVTLNADRQPFWAVLRGICGQVGLEPDGGSLGRIHLFAGEGDWSSFPAAVTGPFLVQANNITRTNTVKFSQPANVERTCNLQLFVYGEPKLRVMPDSASATIDVAVDEHGNKLLPVQGADGSDVTISNNSNGWDVEVELVYPPNAGKKIAQLKGMLHFIVPIKIETMAVEVVTTMRPISRSAGGRRIQVHKARPGQNGAYDVQVTIFRDALTDEEWQQMSNPREFVRLLDDKNHAYQFNGIGESDGNEKQTTMTLHFESPQPTDGQKSSLGKPTQFFWDIPMETRELRVPFEFRDLTLP